MATLVAAYDYCDEHGVLKFQKLRYDPKFFLQRRPGENGNWVWGLSKGKYYRDKKNDWKIAERNKQYKETKEFESEQDLIYNLPDVIAAFDKNRTVFFVEGEKDVESLRKIGLVATTLSKGGTGSKFPKHLLHHFKNKTVIIIPDNDEAGITYLNIIGSSLVKTVKDVHVLELPAFPSTGDVFHIKDVTDFLENGGTREQLIEMARTSPLWEVDDRAEKPEEKKKQQASTIDPVTMPFRFLGQNGGFYHYISDEDKQITRLSADQHTQRSLMHIAPLQWWETYFPGKTSVDWNAACNWSFRMSKKTGLFDTRRIRGRGTWFDNGRVVQHNGDVLIVDGEKYDINDFNTKYIYSASFPLETERAVPLATKDAYNFLQLSRQLLWEKALAGTLFAGWCVVAPICGALSWRPHIWLTGASGCGKSWIIKNIASHVLGPQAIKAQSSTTEAGIRQTLGANGTDAFPIIDDEAEGEDITARKRLQSLLELARVASCENEGHIYKGTSSGKVDAFECRSCFIFASIGVNISQAADASRITVLSLLKDTSFKSADRFDKLKKTTYSLITRDYCAALRARSLKLVPIIISNAETFSRVLATKFDQRTGDQYGAMLAGAYSLCSDKLIDIKDAAEWVQDQDLAEEEAYEVDSDERRCINHIIQHVITYQLASDGKRIDKSIGEILKDKMPSLDEKYALERTGIRYENEVVFVSTSHTGIRKIMSDTPWAKTWGRILKRLDDAEEKYSVRFMGSTTRAIAIPHDIVFQEEYSG